MTIPEFQRHKRDKKKLIVVTAYDALFTRIVEQAGIEAILVGDSLGVVVQGKANTLSVTMDEMLYHTKLVAGAANEHSSSAICHLCPIKPGRKTRFAMQDDFCRLGLRLSSWKVARLWPIGWLR